MYVILLYYYIYSCEYIDSCMEKIKTMMSKLHLIIVVPYFILILSLAGLHWSCGSSVLHTDSAHILQNLYLCRLQGLAHRHFR